MKALTRALSLSIVSTVAFALTLPVDAVTAPSGASILRQVTSRISGSQPDDFSQGRTAAPSVRPVTSCGQLASLAYDFSKVPDAPTVVLSANEVTGGGGPICVVSGYITPQEQFRLELPVDNYAGIYLQEGCGSFCGVQIADTTAVSSSCAGAPGTTINSTNINLADTEMATGTDDQGHTGGDGDALWAMEDPALRVSFGYTSEHALAQAAKAIMAAYYGAPPRYSFYDGCSGGGREALVEAQRYPKDFNGILAGAPGNIEAQLLGVVAAWVIEVNTGPLGREILTSDKLPALHAAVIKACANSNGLIEDPRSCGFNPASVQCAPGTDTSSCLTPAQVRVAREFYLGPNDGHGNFLYPGGEPYGSELAWAGLAIDPSSDHEWPVDTHAYQVGENYLKYAAYWANPPSSFALKDFRFTVSSYYKLMPLAGIYDATDPDLSSFAKAGGKMIMYQGWADEEISPFGTVDYYRSVVQQAGGFATSQRFSRLYMVPAQYHCLTGGSPALSSGSGDSLMLSALENWVVHGTAPGAASFPLAQPTKTLPAIVAKPLDPLVPPVGGQRGLNTKDHWVGQFRQGQELWCNTEGMDLVCSHKTPAISYSTGPSAKVN